MSLPSLQFAISRRGFLGFMGGAGLGLVAYSRFHKPQPTVYPQDTVLLPQELQASRHVAVIGGGLAGLSCAYELSRRGFQVTLLEKSPQLGGKIASWPIVVGEHSFRMEHGFHGFFPQYYNLRSLVDDLKITDRFRSLEFYAVLYRENYAPEIFRPNRSAFPWNIVDLVMSSPNWREWGLDLTSKEHWQVFREISGFHPYNTYDRLDNFSVTDWAKQGFPKGLFDLYFLPFAKSSLNAPDQLSAAELMQFFHFYFFGNPEGLAFNGTRQDMGRSLVDPIAASITKHGGKIFTNVSITNVHWQSGKIAHLGFTEGKDLSASPFWVETNPFLQAITKDSLRYFGASDRVYAWQPGTKVALCLTCPHQGCTVQVAEEGWQCPCHGARFDRQGKVQQGPATQNLTQWSVIEEEKDRLQLATLTPSVVEQTLEADYYVFATDVPGIRHIFQHMTGSAPITLTRQIDRLAIADPFAVCRFWFDRDFPWEQSNFSSLSGYRLTDSITLYHRIQEDYIAWAKATGGSVVELHAYCYKEKEFPTQAHLLETFQEELFTIVPALREAKILHRELVNQKNFSGYPPSSFANRPTTQTEVANLFFAGDWVKMPFPCGLMERAVSSGLLAANAILQEEGLQRRVLYTVSPKGMLSALS